MIKNDRPLPEKLRQLAKWYNLSNPYVHNLLLEAADELENETAWATDYSNQVKKLTHKLSMAENLLFEACDYVDGQNQELFNNIIDFNMK